MLGKATWSHTKTNITFYEQNSLTLTLIHKRKLAFKYYNTNLQIKPHSLNVLRRPQWRTIVAKKCVWLSPVLFQKPWRQGHPSVFHDTQWFTGIFTLWLNIRNFIRVKQYPCRTENTENFASSNSVETHCVEEIWPMPFSWLKTGTQSCRRK